MQKQKTWPGPCVRDLRVRDLRVRDPCMGWGSVSSDVGGGPSMEEDLSVRTHVKLVGEPRVGKPRFG